MSAIKIDTKDSITTQVDQYFAISMKRLKLTYEQIINQDKSELHHSLSIAEDALTNSSSFGTCRMKMMSRANLPFIANVNSNAHFEIGITPLLLEAKSHILKQLEAKGGITHEEEKNILHKLIQNYRNKWLITLGSIIWLISIFLVWWTPQWNNWSIITTHKSYVALSTLLCLAFAGIIWTILDKNKSRKAFAIGSVVIAAIVAASSLL